MADTQELEIVERLIRHTEAGNMEWSWASGKRGNRAEAIVPNDEGKLPIFIEPHDLYPKLVFEGIDMCFGQDYDVDGNPFGIAFNTLAKLAEEQAEIRVAKIRADMLKWLADLLAE